MANSPGRGVVDVGSVIADTYTIEALLGRGGMGAVFLASHKRLAGKHVAIKILHTEIEDVDIVARFKREAEIAAKLNHPNIVGVIDYNVAPDGMPYLVLDYLEGETLAHRIARGRLPLDQVFSIVRQVGSGLTAAHRAGIVHRDLKPQNIFLVPTEVDGRMIEIAKVLDFGISKIRGSHTVQTQDSALLGTPQYMSPEQATGQHARIDERTDVFALGAIVYEMLCGEPAFAGDSLPVIMFKVVYDEPISLAQQAPSTPPAIVSAVARAMAKSADERFPSVAAFVEALTGQPLTLPRAQPPGAAMADAAVASRRNSAGDAFAQTAAPRNPDRAPVDPMLATLAPTTTNLRPAPSPSPGAPVAAAPTAELAAGASPAARRRATALIAAIAIAGAAVAAGAVYVATRQTAHSDAPDRVVASVPALPVPPVAVPPAPQPPPPIAVTPEPAHDPVAVKPVAKPHVPAAARSDARPKPDSAASAGSNDGGDDVNQKLEQASAALKSHNYDLAERLANAVIGSPSSPKQRATARMLHGTVQCVARNDQEAAQIDLRGLDQFPFLKARLVAQCRQAGILTGP